MGYYTLREIVDLQAWAMDQENMLEVAETELEELRGSKKKATDLEIKWLNDNNERLKRQNADLESVIGTIERQKSAVAKSNSEIANNVILVASANYTIAGNILQGYRLLSDSIRSISDEIERKNKMDELYMLQSSIDDLEEKLMEMGKLDEAYSEMKSENIPAQNISQEEIRLLLNICGNVELIKTIVCPEKPISLVTQVLDYLFDIYAAEKYLVICEKGFRRFGRKDEVLFLGLKNKIECEYRNGTPIEICIGEEKIPIYDAQMEILRYKSYKTDISTLIRRGELNLKEGLSKSQMLTLVEELKSQLNNKRIEFEELKSIREFETYVETLNREIGLRNWRNMYFELKNIYRKFKIEAYRARN